MNLNYFCKMRKKLLGIGLAVLFFGSIATSTYGMTTVSVNGETITIVDDDKNKAKAKAKKSDSKECATKTECCSSAKAKSCDDKKGGDKR